MADAFAPPPGPPPPKVPEGWKAQWNEQYKEWFFVNIYTKKSQWDRPTEPIYPPSDDGAPDGPPPSYNPGGARASPAEKGNPNNPYYNQSSNAGSSSTDSDAALAARLQAEEDARAQGRPLSRNAQEEYMNTPMPPGSSSYDQQQLPPRPQEQKRGLFGKLLGGRHSSSSPQPPYQQGYQGYGQQGYGQPQGQYGYPPQQQYYGGGGGYPPQQQYYGGAQQAPPKRHGLGTGGAAALGLGGGLIGGMLLEDAIQDHDQSEYQQGYDQGYDNGADNGGDYGGDGGGDFGGGDF